GRSVVEPHAPLVGIGGAVVALLLVENVAKRLERPGGGRVERGGLPQVARRRLEVAAVTTPLVGLAAAQVGEHRIGAQSNGAAVRFDGVEGQVVAQGGVAADQEGAVFLLTGGGLVGEGGTDGGSRQKSHRRNGPSHRQLAYQPER